MCGIAGSLRNSFRTSPVAFFIGGRALVGMYWRKPGRPVKLRIPINIARESDCGGKAPWSKEQELRPSSKVPKSWLSVEGSDASKTDRRLA